jgi:GxxExxY protein
MTAEDYNQLTRRIINCAFKVHSELGPGLMESVYDICLFHELTSEGLFVERQKLLPVQYRNELLDKTFIIDLLVEDKVIVELKSLEGILPVHEAQLVSYLRLAEKQLGLLINFNVAHLKDGIRRKINGNLTAVK